MLLTLSQATVPQHYKVLAERPPSWEKFFNFFVSLCFLNYTPLRWWSHSGRILGLSCNTEMILTNIYIHITAASRAVWYIARACAGDILYVPEGFSPRRTYFRIARRAHRARVLYDFSAREARLIWNISTRGALSKTHFTT